MIIDDPVWGEWPLDEPVLLELLASAPVQRLAGVHQSGAGYLVRPELTTTRLEHSLGALRLVRWLGGSIEQQVAALLHDVPHTAFSHVVDLVFPDARPSYHEHQHARVVCSSEIPAILGRHGIALEWAIEPERAPLLERPLPNLCADRVDYAIRDMQRLGTVRHAEIDAFMRALVVFDGRMALASLDAARWFMELYRDANLRLYMNPVDIWAYEQLADILRRGLARGIIAEPDLFATDDGLLARLRADPDLAARLAALTPDAVAYVHGAAAGAAVRLLYPKARAADPLVVVDGRVERATALDPSLRSVVAETLARARGGVPIPDGQPGDSVSRLRLGRC